MACSRIGETAVFDGCCIWISWVGVQVKRADKLSYGPQACLSVR
jgi:hypothetical protein